MVSLLVRHIGLPHPLFTQKICEHVQFFTTLLIVSPPRMCELSLREKEALNRVIHKVPLIPDSGPQFHPKLSTK